jgi:uncharacterized protein YcfJ
MNKSLAMGLAIGAVVAVAGGAVASYTLKDPGEEFAQVTNVEPVMKTVREPRQECHDVTSTTQAPTRDKHRITGTVIGAVVGGVVGNQIGSGSGRDISRIAGAAAGGYAGNRVQKRMQDNNTVTTTERKCATVYGTRKEQAGYEVSYRLGDQTGTVHMDRDPGERIPVKDGQLLIADASTPAS